MTTDIERELRELFRDKVGEAPVSTLGTSGAPPPQVLRRGRRRQVGTVLGSALVAVALAVGSFAGLRSLLRSETDPFQTGQYERTPATEPRADEVELAGDAFGQRYRVRFTGAFADDTACIHVMLGGQRSEPLCPRPLETSLAGTQPSMHGVTTTELNLLFGSVSPEVVAIRFASDDGTDPPTQFRCQMGPLGWTDPDRKVCVMALPSQGSGLFEYLDSGGGVLFEEGMGWGVSEAEAVAPMPVDPAHGGSYWGVYVWLGSEGNGEANDLVGQLFDEHGVQAHQGDLACDRGAAEALGTDASWRVAVYFGTEEEANAFALEAGLLGHEADPVIARVTTYCLD